ncbi:hypothetical protein CXU10_04305 [Akkermansia muciniphila]|nr:hypothetical protein CXU10_04305 [Akkermansia muciniphila]
MNWFQINSKTASVPAEPEPGKGKKGGGQEMRCPAIREAAQTVDNPLTVPLRTHQSLLPEAGRPRMPGLPGTGKAARLFSAPPESKFPGKLVLAGE